jgi:hypothetical protein
MRTYFIIISVVTVSVCSCDKQTSQVGGDAGPAKGGVIESPLSNEGASGGRGSGQSDLVPERALPPAQRADFIQNAIDRLIQFSDTSPIVRTQHLLGYTGGDQDAANNLEQAERFRVMVFNACIEFRNKNRSVYDAVISNPSDESLSIDQRRDMLRISERNHQDAVLASLRSARLASETIDQLLRDADIKQRRIYETGNK